MTKLYVSDTTQVVSVNGVSARFTAGVHRPVRPALVNACLAAGVRVVGLPEPEAASADTPDPVIVDELPPIEYDMGRQAAIVDAIELIMVDGDQGSFTANGAIRKNILDKQVGFSVSAEERDAAMASIKTALDTPSED